MKLLHLYIIELGSKYNTEDRVTKMYIDKEVIKNFEHKGDYRLVTWSMSREETKKSEEFKNETDMSTSIQIDIEKACLNSGLIEGTKLLDSIGHDEILISAYSKCTAKRIAGENFKIVLAKDDSSMIIESKIN